MHECCGGIMSLETVTSNFEARVLKWLAACNASQLLLRYWAATYIAQCQQNTQRSTVDVHNDTVSKLYAKGT